MKMKMLMLGEAREFIDGRIEQQAAMRAINRKKCQCLPVDEVTAPNID